MTTRVQRAVPRTESTLVHRMLALVTLCIAATSAVALVTHLGADGPRAAAAPSSGVTPGTLAPAAATADTRALAQWLRANLPSATPVLADPTVAGLLRGSGATDDVTACRAGSVVLLTEAMRQSARQDATLSGCIGRSYAIAALGSDQVRAVAADLPAARRARATALALQKRGGEALAANPAITMPSEVRTVLAGGRLDLRAEAVLSELSALAPLHLVAIDDIAAETRAGMPARIVEISTADRTVIEPRLRAVAPDYRPVQITSLGTDTLRLTWPFRIDLPPVLD